MENQNKKTKKLSMDKRTVYMVRVTDGVIIQFVITICLLITQDFSEMFEQSPCRQQHVASF